MSHKVKQVASVTVEQWISPGKEQTLEELKQKFDGRILEVDEANQRLLIVRSQTSPRY